MASFALGDGTTLAVRPIETSDAERLRRMFDRLSPETVYHRFFSPISRPRDAVLHRLARVDHRDREALVALDGDEIVGVARYDAGAGSDAAEIAVTVEDAWQDRGLGTALATRLARLARRRGLHAFTAIVMGENRAAVRFLKHVSPDADVRLDGGEWVAYAPLRPAEPLRAGRSARR